MAIPRKKNIAGYYDDQGRFRPIRSPQFVGTSRRKATKTDRRKYSKAKAGDLGERRQKLAREDVFDREIRLAAEANAKFEKGREAEWRQIQKDVAGSREDGRLSDTLIQFVRRSGGIRRTFRHGGRKVRGKRSSWDAGEIDRLSFKQTGKRGLTTDTGGKSLDRMFQAAKEEGYPVSDMWDLISRVEDEAAGQAPTYPTHGYLDYRDNPAMKGNKTKARRNPAKTSSRSHIASEALLKTLRAETRKLTSRIVNGKIKRNPVGWFRDVSPVTPDAVKKLYRKLAAQWHPDKAGGDLRKMQEINADYDKAIKVAAGNEGNANRATAERNAAKPLREAIEFAVTLPDDVNVVIRGLWLWLEGNTYKAREQIKSFKSSDGNKFKWASKKKAWFFAAVPSSNRGREYSFEEIDALHGRELVNERKKRLGLRANPIDPLGTFTTAAVGLASALQIKEYVDAKKQLAALERKKRKKNGKTTAQSKKRAMNPVRETVQQKEARRLLKGLIAQIKDYPSRDVVGSAYSLMGYLPARARATAERHIEAARKAGSKKHPAASGAVRNPKPVATPNPTLAEINRCRRIVAAADREKAKWVDVPIIRHQNPSAKLKVGDKFKVIINGRPAGIERTVARVWKEGGYTMVASKNGLQTYNEFEVAKVGRSRANPSLKKRGSESTTCRQNPPKKVPHRRTFSMFNGRPATKVKAMPVSRHAPPRLDQLGDLIEVKLTTGQILKTNPKRFKLCAARGKLWITGGKFAKANPAEKTNILNPVAEIAHVVYGTTKPHHGDNSYTHYIHKLGEESGRRPILAVDREGFPVIRGGNYTIEARGIVD